MKTKVIILIALVCSINLTIIATLNSKGSSDVTLESFFRIAQADVDLPEIIITCGQTYGKCWVEHCHTKWTPFGPARVTACPEFSGMQADACVPGAPCYF